MIKIHPYFLVKNKNPLTKYLLITFDGIYIQKFNNSQTRKKCGILKLNNIDLISHIAVFLLLITNKVYGGCGNAWLNFVP